MKENDFIKLNDKEIGELLTLALGVILDTYVTEPGEPICEPWRRRAVRENLRHLRSMASESGSEVLRNVSRLDRTAEPGIYTRG